MNKILRLGLLLTLLSFCMSGFSQISVTSFEQLPNNLDATTYHPKKDINGKTCAIIKIYTTQKGFSFDNGSLGIVAVEQKSDLAEIWVYVPEKTRKLKIAHPQLGHIKTGDNVDSEGYYWLPSAVESGQVYKMDIVTGKVRIEIEEAKVQTGWLVFNSVPEGADIYLSQQGEEEKHIGTTPMSKKMPYGTYNYRAKKFKYHDDVGIATVDKTRVTMDLKLMPAFGSVAVSSQPQGARVFLDGEDTGKVTPCTIGGVASGSCNISLQLKDYAPASRTVTVADGQTAGVQVALEARFATVTINSLPGATIKVNGAAVGTGGYNSNMAEGIYDLEATLSGHRAVTKQIEVVAGLPQTIDLRPTPIYGMLDVNSNPMGAAITINGKSYGDTPTTIENLLVGDYDVVLSKTGYASVTQRVSISETSPAAIDVKMPKGELDVTVSNAQNEKNQLSASDSCEYLKRYARETYERMKKNLEVSHIMFPLGDNDKIKKANKAKMDSIRTCIVNGEDFGLLAEKYSSDVFSAKDKGKLGYVWVGRFPYAFEDAAYKTPIGEISPVVETPFGFHIIKVTGEHPTKGKYKVAHIIKFYRKNDDDSAKAVLKQKMDSIYKLLVNGADFATVAKKESDFSKTSRNGDEFGWEGIDQMVEPMNTVMQTTPVGEISKPIVTDYGVHIIKVLAHKPLGTYEENEEDIIAMLKKAL